MCSQTPKCQRQLFGICFYGLSACVFISAQILLFFLLHVMIYMRNSKMVLFLVWKMAMFFCCPVDPLYLNTFMWRAKCAILFCWRILGHRIKSFMINPSTGSLGTPNRVLETKRVWTCEFVNRLILIKYFLQALIMALFDPWTPSMTRSFPQCRIKRCYQSGRESNTI